jgi:hypothetical protein
MLCQDLLSCQKTKVLYLGALILMDSLPKRTGRCLSCKETLYFRNGRLWCPGKHAYLKDNRCPPQRCSSRSCLPKGVNEIIERRDW